MLAVRMEGTHNWGIKTTRGTTDRLPTLLGGKLAIVDWCALQIDRCVDDPIYCKLLWIFVDEAATPCWCESAITFSLPGIWRTERETWNSWQRDPICQARAYIVKERVPPCFSMYARTVMLSVAINNADWAINVWKWVSARSTALIFKTLICSCRHAPNHRPCTVCPAISAH